MYVGSSVVTKLSSSSRDAIQLCKITQQIPALGETDTLEGSKGILHHRVKWHIAIHQKRIFSVMALMACAQAVLGVRFVFKLEDCILATGILVLRTCYEIDEGGVRLNANEHRFYRLHGLRQGDTRDSSVPFAHRERSIVIYLIHTLYNAQ